MSTAIEPSTLVREHPVAPVRIVHLGLGAFSRSHTAWYTAHASDADDWGIAAYSGRSASLAEALAAQENLYTVIERCREGDRAEVIGAISRSHPGADSSSLFADIAADTTSIITLTITEAGYRATRDGDPDLGDPLVAADIDLLRALEGADDPRSRRLETQLGRLLWGLELRRRAHGEPLAVVSCDNIPDNGGHVRRIALALARLCLPELADWCIDHVSFVSSSVDRITPRISAAEAEHLAQQYGDNAPVLTEPFRDWVLAGDFPAGRPNWESAGARFTDDLEPWEARKLWLLNGAHTLLACLGLARGHVDVAHAMADPLCRDAVEAFWDEAARHLPKELEIPAYRSALVERFENPRIVHHLAQIAADTPTKLALRIVPVAERERLASRPAPGCATALGAWVVAAERGLVAAGDGERRGGGDGVQAVCARLRTLSTALAEDSTFAETVSTAAERLRCLTLR